MNSEEYIARSKIKTSFDKDVLTKRMRVVSRLCDRRGR